MKEKKSPVHVAKVYSYVAKVSLKCRRSPNVTSSPINQALSFSPGKEDWSLYWDGGKPKVSVKHFEKYPILSKPTL